MNEQLINTFFKNYISIFIVAIDKFESFDAFNCKKNNRYSMFDFLMLRKNFFCEIYETKRREIVDFWTILYDDFNAKIRKSEFFIKISNLNVSINNF